MHGVSEFIFGIWTAFRSHWNVQSFLTVCAGASSFMRRIFYQTQFKNSSSLIIIKGFWLTSTDRAVWQSHGEIMEIFYDGRKKIDREQAANFICHILRSRVFHTKKENNQHPGCMQVLKTAQHNHRKTFTNFTLYGKHFRFDLVRSIRIVWGYELH